MKNFVRRYFAIPSTATNDPNIGKWYMIYRYSPTNTSLKALVLSLLVKNTSYSSSHGDINVNLYIGRHTQEGLISDNPDTGPTVIYPLITSTEVLSNKDEFFLDRTKNLIVLNAGDGIAIKCSAGGIYAYCSILENVN